MDWTQQPRDTFTLQGDFYNQDFGESVSITTYNPPVSYIQDGAGQPLRRKHSLALANESRARKKIFCWMPTMPATTATN